MRTIVQIENLATLRRRQEPTPNMGMDKTQNLILKIMDAYILLEMLKIRNNENIY